VRITDLYVCPYGSDLGAPFTRGALFFCWLSFSGKLASRRDQFHTDHYAKFEVRWGGLSAILARRQLLGRLEQVKLGFEQRDLLCKGADLLSLVTILGRLVAAERIPDSCLR
jgi:hypothetical protein